jgi:cytosine/adenosine deaminase-related metal-dependent hydrolase
VPVNTAFWCDRAWLPGGVADRVLIGCSPGGVVSSVASGVDAPPGAVRLAGMVFPGFANGHSHAFHRALRGRTHCGGGTFWTWRKAMYRLAGVLDPDRYLRLARLVYAEMALAGYVAVGEFHYLHHPPGGGRYAQRNAMGVALIEAARESGIRLTLLDTCYLAGDLEADGYRPLSGPQARFSDGDVDGWLNRVTELDAQLNAAAGVPLNAVAGVPPGAGRSALSDVVGSAPLNALGGTAPDVDARRESAPGVALDVDARGGPAAGAPPILGVSVPRNAYGGVRRDSSTRCEKAAGAPVSALAGVQRNAPGVRIGAAVHSVRAVPAEALPAFAAATRDRPVHVHLSEQPAENEACLAFHGRTPTELLADAGLLGSHTTAVHATHLSASDIALLGAAEVTACFCPSTEADLADGIGPARELADAGCPISLGSDQHAVIDALAETRALEHGERLRTGQRGRFGPTELVRFATEYGHRSLGWRGAGRIAHGAPCDLVSLRTDTVRTAGATPEQLVLAASATDVHTVVVGGVMVVRDGVHRVFGAVGPALAEVIEELWNT